ncbi:MAG: hypothetical protein ABEJ71_04210 [Halodesulfurarchaeum sp.]
MSALAFRQRDHEGVNPVVPAVGLIGAAGFFPLMLWHLYRSEPGTFYTVVVITVAVFLVELLYFERETIEREIDAVEEQTLGEDESLPPEPKE